MVGGNIAADGAVFAQKGIHNMTVTDIGTNGIRIDFPAHPDGSRYLLLFSSTEYHWFYRNATSTSVDLYTRTLSNGNSGTDGGGSFGVCIYT